MLSSLFNGIFDSSATASIEVYQFLLCLIVSLIIGIFLACTYGRKEVTTRSFLVTLAVLPAIVCVIIMLVNGNIGAGVAVAGAFSLVRFRSVPGSGKEISSLFLAMGAGLITGMGYLAYAVLFTVILALAMNILSGFTFGAKDLSDQKDLRITIPEDLNYDEVFDPILDKYTSEHMLQSVKTTNMGSMFKLRYYITMKDRSQEKAMIDELRTRNGNLEITVSGMENVMTGGEAL